MNSERRKRSKKSDLPKRYRSRDKYNRALDFEINKLVSVPNNDAHPRTDPESDTAALLQDTRYELWMPINWHQK